MPKFEVEVYTTARVSVLLIVEAPNQSAAGTLACHEVRTVPAYRDWRYQSRNDESELTAEVGPAI